MYVGHVFQTASRVPCTELAWQLRPIQISLAAVTKEVGAASLQSLGHASDELCQITVLLAGLDLTIRSETIRHTSLESSRCLASAENHQFCLVKPMVL